MIVVCVPVEYCSIIVDGVDGMRVGVEVLLEANRHSLRIYEVRR